jgi:hypothetical protein
MPSGSLTLLMFICRSKTRDKTGPETEGRALSRGGRHEPWPVIQTHGHRSEPCATDSREPESVTVIHPRNQLHPTKTATFAVWFSKPYTLRLHWPAHFHTSVSDHPRRDSDLQRHRESFRTRASRIRAGCHSAAQRQAQTPT